MKNRPLPSPPPVPPATRAEVVRFLKGLQQFRAKGRRPFDEAEVKKYDEAGVKAYLDKMTTGSQQGIARRIMMDILKSSPSKGGEKPERKRKPTRKKAPKAKSTRASKKKRSPAKKQKANRRR
jgi:hypothetical protein